MAKQDVANVAAGVGVWSAKGDPYISGRVGQLLAQPGGLSIPNAATWRKAAMAVTWREGVNGLYGAGSVPLPDDFPPLEIALPTGEWIAPDYFDLGSVDKVDPLLNCDEKHNS